MAINDISLTAGMRANLLSLQGTVDLLNRTQNRLSTGKKVNSALDNPTSYFTAQALSARAGDIDALKDAMGQAIQTVTAADKGITGITALIEQARGIAQKAQTVSAGGGNVTEYVTLSGVSAGDTVTIGGVLMTATAAANSTTEFHVGANDSETAANLMLALNSSAATVTASKVEGAKVYLQDTGSDLTATSVQTPGAQTSISESDLLPAAGNELSTLEASYNAIRDQIDNMALDSGYGGKNLLNNDTLTVKFEGTHTLDVIGFHADSANLGITAASWAAPTDASADVTKLETSLSTLRSQSSSLSSNLNIITTREDFSQSMVDTLTSGSDKLTLADMNEEGANMLMLQTRQALGTTALSLSSQAAQSVLRLFG